MHSNGQGASQCVRIKPHFKPSRSTHRRVNDASNFASTVYCRSSPNKLRDIRTYRYSTHCTHTHTHARTVSILYTAKSCPPLTPYPRPQSTAPTMHSSTTLHASPTTRAHRPATAHGPPITQSVITTYPLQPPTRLPPTCLPTCQATAHHHPSPTAHRSTVCRLQSSP